jgi:hypothetical protein
VPDEVKKDEPQPIADSPPIIREAVEQTKEAIDCLLEAYPPSKKNKKLAEEAADHLRRVFSHLDDMCLAAIAAYIVTNVVMMGSASESPDLLLVAVTYAYITRELAWELWDQSLRKPLHGGALPVGTKASHFQR